MNKKLRVIYAGTPDFAVPALEALIQSRHDVVAVYTQPDRAAGRGRKIKFGPVKQVAVDADIPVEQPENFKTEESRQTLRDYHADVMVVAAYGLILPQVVLDTPKYGCLNIHGSLLPRWRGAAPIHRAIQQGDEVTGVTIMQMAAGLDTGDMLYKVECPITAKDTVQTIHDCLAKDGAVVLLKVLDDLCDGKLTPEVQDDALANYAHKLTKAEAEIDWSQSAVEIDRMIRAFSAWPTAFTQYQGKPLKLQMSEVIAENTLANAGEVITESKEGIDIATGDGVLRIIQLQMSGGKRLSARDFLNARSLLGGEVSLVNARVAAAYCIQRVIYQGASLTDVLQNAASQYALSDSDSALVNDIAYGCLRWHERLGFILSQLLVKSLKNKDKDVECLLRVALYQLLYQRKPDHAVVNEAVKATKGLKKPWSRGLVNGVLRSFQRKKDEILQALEKDELAHYSFPQWLFDEIQTAWPKQWKQILSASNARAPMALRTNLSRISRDEYLQVLENKKIKAEAAAVTQSSILLSEPVNVFDLPGFSTGQVSVQDTAAQIAAEILDCQPGMRVLDACAAPGGKTGHILETCADIDLVAIDNQADRLNRVQENLSRLEFEVRLVRADAADTASWSEGKLFDRILLDAPCSATGVIRRHPDIKQLRKPADIHSLPQQQKRLLEALWKILKPGGKLVYATCSILPVENDAQIQSFVEAHQDVDVEMIDADWGEKQACGRQILPGDSNMDGFYYAVLKKVV